ncbi:glycosyltransferase family 9 protein, partial [Thermodesulfobacteriota bacterium]
GALAPHASATALIAFLTGAPQCVGRIKNSSLRSRIYSTPIQADWENDHRSRYFIRAVAEACGASAPASIAPPELTLKQDRTDIAQEGIGLNIGASTESRRWSEQNFFKLAKRLYSKGFDVRVILGPQEEFLVKTTQAVCFENNWDFSFHAHIETLIEALRQCRLLISNDTGPGHLAAAVGVPVITLFSTGSPENVKPLAKQARWFRNKTDINRIKVSEVEKACLAILNTRHH